MNRKKFLLLIIFIDFFSPFSLLSGGFTGSWTPRDKKTEKETEKFLKKLQQVDLAPKEYKIVLKTKDGLKRKAILTIKPNAKGNMVLCHPAAYDKDLMKPYEEQLFKDYNCLRFDFRRHGEDCAKQYSTIGKHEAREVEAAVNIFKKNHKTKKLPVFAFGISMGAAAILEAESKKNLFDGIILQSCFEKLRNQIKRMFAFYRLPLAGSILYTAPVNLYAKTRYRIKMRKNNPVDNVKKIKTPIFLIHAQNDNFVAFEAFEAIKKSAGSVYKTWTPEDGKHTKLLSTYPDLYAKKCNEFLSSLLPEPKKKKNLFPMSSLFAKLTIK